MNKAYIKITFSICILSLLAFGVNAAPLALTDTEMDSVAAGGTPTEAGFVCPVITTDAVLNSPKGGALGIEGYYTIGATSVNVPVHATNGDGAGSPPGPFSVPGDRDYTAIWHTAN